MERGQGGEGWENIRCSNIEGLNVTLAWDYGFSKYHEDPKCYMFLESSQKMLIEYQHDNVKIHGHGHEYVHLLD